MGFKVKLQRLENNIKNWRLNVNQTEKDLCSEHRKKIDCLDTFINGRRNRSRISGFNINGDWLTGPVVEDPLVIYEFRPISLIESQYKIISKILANFLSLVVSLVVSDVQMAYIKGLLIGAKMSRCHHWKPLVGRSHKCLSQWKSKSFAFGGCLTLIRSVLGSLGVYYFSNFEAPKNVISLGITILSVFNQAILTKWWWRFKTKEDATWCKVIHSIHGPRGGLQDNSSLKSDSSPWALHFTRELEEVRDLPNLLSQFCLSNEQDPWEFTVNASRKFIVNGFRSHVTSVSQPLLSQPNI
nr:hypothetical protein [Tanacetum cinerariifolium]